MSYIKRGFKKSNIVDSNIELTKKEKLVFDQVAFGFNVKKRTRNVLLDSSKKPQLYRDFSMKLLLISIGLNLFALICFFVCFAFIALENETQYVGSTEVGGLYLLNTSRQLSDLSPVKDVKG